MKRIFLVLAGILTFWFFAKALGLTGRQFSNGLNVSNLYTLSEINEGVTVQADPTFYGIYRYHADLEFEGKRSTEEGRTVDVTIGFKEYFCSSGRTIGESELSISVTGRRQSQNGFGPYGRLVKSGLLGKGKQICLDIWLDEVREGETTDVDLSVTVMNTRPCWFVECLLD